MDRSAIDYLNYLENSDPFFYKNFKDFIVYASGLNKNLNDDDYYKLRDAKDGKYRVTLKDKKTAINIVKNFFYKISPNIIRQIDYDISAGKIVFLNKDQMGNQSSRIVYDRDNYRIEILESCKIEESYLLAREYARLFVSNISEVNGYDSGLKSVYIEVIISLTEFALAKHLSNNKVLYEDSNVYIRKKIYDSIYKMNDSYMTLIYLGYLLEGKEHDEISKVLGNADVVDKLNNIIRNKLPCADYINTLGTMLALKLVNKTSNIFELVNIYFVKATSRDFAFFVNSLPVLLNQNDSVNDIIQYLGKV